MIVRARALLRRLRRWLDRREWAIRLLGLSLSSDPPDAPGLVLVQIDGLALAQVQRALASGRMPYLASMLRNGGYRLRPVYSGVPSNTPAFQGELFYGVKAAVPAFSFVARDSGRRMRMYDPSAAALIEARLAASGAPLLAGGSAYSNIYTGGAAESHFCASSLGWSSFLQAANPVALGILFVSHSYSLVRVIVLLLIEFLLAIWDLFSGLIEGHDFFKELKFVPTRVAICILLREFITIGAGIDATRGLPVIQFNYVGYDEQSHRRGPSSAFAHWTLRGIDAALARVVRAAKRSARRDYQVWIYSDHGQEEAQSYHQVHGISIEDAVARVVSRVERDSARSWATRSRGRQSSRAALLGGSRLQKVLPTYPADDRTSPDDAVARVEAMGPVGLIYLAQHHHPEDLDRIGRELATAAGVPLVLKAEEPGRLTAWTSEGRFTLPRERARVLGPDHPFLDAVTRDLDALCRHPDAGDLVICGWRVGVANCSFADENGSHAGLGPHETSGFALLPRRMSPASTAGSGGLRAVDLRAAALHLLGRVSEPLHAAPQMQASARPAGAARSADLG